MLQTWADIALIVFVLLFAFVTVALFAVMAFAVKKIEQQIEKLTNMAEPVIVRATNTLDTVQRITANERDCGWGTVRRHARRTLDVTKSSLFKE